MRLLHIFFVLPLVFYPQAARSESPVDVVKQATLASMEKRQAHLPWYEPVAKRFFTNSLRTTLSNLQAMNDCNYWDADIISGKQSEDSVKILKLIELSNTANISTVSATLQLSIDGEMQQQTQQFILARENGNWKIDEIIFDGAKWYPTYGGTLHSYLRSVENRRCK
jgi:hypothetical protein